MLAFPHHAMILAAGLGTRMRPLTNSTPKPLIEVAGRPLLDRALDRLVEAGITQAVVNISYKAEMIEAHLASRKSPVLLFSREETPLETGGGIRQALPFLGRTSFFSMNADVITLSGQESFLHRMSHAWQGDMQALLLVHPVSKAVGYSGPGDFSLQADGTLSRRADETAPYVFTGVQLLSPALFENAPEGAFSMNRLYERLLAQNRLYGLVHDGDWLHVGDLAGLAEAERFLSTR